MSGIAFLIAVISQFTPYFSGLSELPPTSQIQVDFDRIYGMNTGSPVIADGYLIGQVASIESAASTSEKNNQPSYRVTIELNPYSRFFIPSSYVALLSHPCSSVHPDGRTVIEFLSVSSSAAGTLPIRGYSSLEAFWRSGIS